jgi:hypothetical protein
LCSVDPKLLKLTPHDDNIYKTFREEFPDLKVDVLDEVGLKSSEAKQVFYFEYLPNLSFVIWLYSICLCLEAEFCSQVACVSFTVKSIYVKDTTDLQISVNINT